MADLADRDYWDTAILRASGRLMMLAAIAQAPGHGYEIARRLTAVCGDWCQPSPAMIYPAIHELEAAGLITCEVDDRTARKRRICTLTGPGAVEGRVRPLPPLLRNRPRARGALNTVDHRPH